jgi:hypothetical protein
VKVGDRVRFAGWTFLAGTGGTVVDRVPNANPPELLVEVDGGFYACPQNVPVTWLEPVAVARTRDERVLASLAPTPAAREARSEARFFAEVPAGCCACGIARADCGYHGGSR